MITVKYLKKALSKLPDDALVYAYEGEATGIVIVSTKKDKYGGRKELKFIPAYESNKNLTIPIGKNNAH